ncbi:hypothetical protein GOODEAATRI_004863 [Goodea atripinnis]|uniref:Tight junction protein 3 n=1 Tax=Goodea atripinnis TaxID=208336 RepID=A0ABV0MPD9_9TELE
MTTENLSLLETKHLVEKSRGKLTMTVLRDDRKFLVSIPEVDDSPGNSNDELRKNSSSELEDLEEDITPRRTSRQHTREKRTRRSLSDLPHISLKPSPIPVRQEAPRRINSPVRIPPPDASYASVPRKDFSDNGNVKKASKKRRVLSKKAAPAAAKLEPPHQVKSPSRPAPDGGFTPFCVAFLLSFYHHTEYESRLAVTGPDRSLFLFFKSPQSQMSFHISGGLAALSEIKATAGGVQPNSPAYDQGMKEGDQILKVNNVDFGHFTREEAANFLLNLPAGEQVEMCTQKKMDIYNKIIKSNLGDNFYIRTHFDHEADNPRGLSFTRGEVFRVLDTMYKGKIGNWLAVRMGNDLHELDKGTVPNQERAEKLATIERSQRSTGERQGTGPRAEFWKLRGLRGNKKNEKSNRRTREDLLQLTIQGKFPAYERVLLREEMVPRSGGGDNSSTVIKLDTVRRIAEKDKHPLLDITPTAVERLNYIQYHPMVLFLDPHSRKDVKAMRQKYNPDSNKSSRRLYSQAVKMRKHANHLFSGISHMDYLSAASDLEDTDGEAITDGEAYTDNEDLEEAYPGQDVSRFQQSSRGPGAALARSSEPASEYDRPAVEPEPSDYGFSDREIPPLMHVPELRSPHQEDYSPPQSTAEEEEQSHHSFSDSDFDALDVDEPPDFVAPDPSSRHSLDRPSYAEEQPESSQPAPLSAIEERLAQTRMAEPQAQPEKKTGPAFIV